MIVTSAKEGMLYPVFVRLSVCLSVCLSVNIFHTKTTDRMFMKLLLEICLWTRKLKLGRHLDLEFFSGSRSLNF